MRPVLPGQWVWLVFLFCLAVPAVTPAAERDWRPVPPEELSMTREPLAPGAPAIYLYRQFDRDDTTNREFVYTQIKILTEEGRDRANVQISYNKRIERIRDLEARVIQPDGSITPFTGTVFEKPIASNSEVREFAKTFTLPDIRIGSIIEYRFVRDERDETLYDSRWILSQDLFTKHASFSLDPYPYRALRWSWPLALPEGSGTPAMEKGKVRLTVNNIAPFVSEPFMPPANNMKVRVDFVYTAEENLETDPEKFWKKFGKDSYQGVQRFTNRRSDMKKAVETIIAAGDSEEQKVRKIYRHVQAMRNTTYEPELDEEEARRSKDRDAVSVSSVWKNNYGDNTELLWYFLALVRAADVKAEPVLVGSRQYAIFDHRVMNPRGLNSYVVAVWIGGKEVLLDPATPHLPYGTLHWSDTLVRALRLDAEGGQWFNTPAGTADATRIQRVANLKLTSEGTLEGKVTVTYTGQEAIWRRLQQRHEDEPSRREFLEDDLKTVLPASAEPTLVSQPDWAAHEGPLVVEYELRIPGWAVEAGDRFLLGMGLFGGGQKNMFTHAARKHPVYFTYPVRSDDDITIALPAGAKVQTLPSPRNVDIKALAFAHHAEGGGETLRLKRNLTMNLTLVEARAYGGIRDFFQKLRAGDEDQIVIARR